MIRGCACQPISVPCCHAAYPAGDPGSYEVIHLGGEAAAIVPLGELRQLQAVQRHASPELLEEAEVEATLAAHREWVTAGRPGPSRMKSDGWAASSTRLRHASLGRLAMRASQAHVPTCRAKITVKGASRRDGARATPDTDLPRQDLGTYREDGPNSTSP